MTARGFSEADFEKSVGLVDRGLDLAKEIEKESGTQTIPEFKAYIDSVWRTDPKMGAFRKEVGGWCKGFDFLKWEF
jgi:hypothetical protein